MFKRGRFSGYLRPISYFIDLSIINVLAYHLFSNNFQILNFIIFTSIAWIIASLRSNFYEIYRFTQLVKILSLIIKQGVIFTLIIFAFFGYYGEVNKNPLEIFKYIILVFIFIAIFKLAIYYLLKKYRKLLGGNFRNTIIIGKNRKTEQLEKFFIDNPTFGYQHQKTFDIRGNSKDSIQDSFEYILNNPVDEIYSSVAELTNAELLLLIDFADNNLKILKFLPDNKEIYSKKLDFTYYGFLPILALRKIPMEEPFNKFIKRFFDIALSLF